MSTTRPTLKAPWWRQSRFIGWLVVVAVLVAAGFSTTVVSGKAAVAADTAAAWVDLNYDSVVVPAIQSSAQPISDLIPALVADPNAAGEKWGKHEDATKPYSFAVKATGTLVKGEFGEVGLQVPGLPDAITIGIAIPPLGSATAIRDAGTNLVFGDFVNQTEFQNVAIELDKRAAAAVYGSLDLPSKIGQQATVVGAFTWVSPTGGTIDHVTILPVEITVG